MKNVVVVDHLKALEFVEEGGVYRLNKKYRKCDLRFSFLCTKMTEQSILLSMIGQAYQQGRKDGKQEKVNELKKLFEV